MNINQAVRALREALGETQQSLAVRLGLAVSTIVKYEANRTPRGKTLAQFYTLARTSGLQELAAVFNKALISELVHPGSDMLELIAYVNIREWRKKLRLMLPKKQAEALGAEMDRVLSQIAASDAFAVAEALSVEQKESK